MTTEKEMPKFEKQLDTYLRARFTFIVLVTHEEERALQMIRRMCDETHRSCMSWDAADGFQWVSSGTGTLPAARDPLTALEQIGKMDGQIASLFVLKDFHDFWQNAQVRRKLRSLSQEMKFTKKSILILTPSSRIPDELKDEIVLEAVPLPDAGELQKVLEDLTNISGVRINLTPLGKEKLVKAAIGLTASQAQRVFAKAIVRDGMLDDTDIDLVTDEKKQIIRESEALEFFPVTETLDNVGGLKVLKEWLRLRDRAFSRPRARIRPADAQRASP